MSLSRGTNLFKTITSIRKPASVFLISARNSSHGYMYRPNGPPPHTTYQKVWSNGLMGFMWWWVLYHFWHEPGHIFGEFPYPDTSKWTDEELGIPPDDAD